MFSFWRRYTITIPDADEFLDLRFPESRFGRRIEAADRDQQRALAVRQRGALLYIQNITRCRSARIWSICALRRRTRGPTIAERKAAERREVRQRIVAEAMNSLEDICDAPPEDLRELVKNPDTPPLVSIMAEQALRSRA